MSNLKVEGKVGDFCLNCKNCKAVTRIHDGKNASIRIIEVDCEDPYDGMVKTLDADSDICCSMFEPKPPCEKCERFDGSYCHSPNMPREALEAKILDLFEEKNRLNGIINSLEKEKAAHMKGIERLKKSQEKLQNQVKNLQTTNEESYKREEKLEDKCHKLAKRFDRLNTEFLIPLAHVLYPDEQVCKPYSEILKDIKELEKISTYYDRYKTLTDKVQSLLFQDDHTYEFDEIIKKIKNLKVEAEENETMYNDLNYWKERCHNAETDVTTLNSKVEVLKNKNDKYLKKIIDQQMTDYKQRARILELECAVNKLQSGEYDDILAKDIEIKSLQTKYGDVMSGWNHTMELYEKLKNEVDKLKNENTSLNTINKGLAEDRKKLINYMRSLKIASENYLKEFTYEED